MEHLKITVFLHTPVLLGHPWIFFDGIVAHLVLLENLGEKYFELPSNYPVQEIVDSGNIPLKRVYSKGDYFFAASVSFFEDVGRTVKYCVTHFRKKIAEEYIHEVKSKKKKIRTGSGFFRLYDMKMLYVPCRKVVFYADGEKSEIERLRGELKTLRSEIPSLIPRPSEGYSQDTYRLIADVLHIAAQRKPVQEALEGVGRILFPEKFYPKTQPTSSKLPPDVEEELERYGLIER